MSYTCPTTVLHLSCRGACLLSCMSYPPMLLIFILKPSLLEVFSLLSKYAKSQRNPSLGSGNFQPVFARSIDHKYTRLSRHFTWMLQLTVAARFLALTAVSVFNTQVPRVHLICARGHSLSCRNDQSDFLRDFAEPNF